MDCLLCGKEAKLLDNNWIGYQEPDTYEIHFCENCNTSFSYPQDNNSEIYDHIYKNSSRLPGYKRYFNYAETINSVKNPLEFLSKEEIYWSVKKVLEKEISDKKKYKIIDIGCGLGYLTYALRDSGYDIIGVDISENAIEQAKTKFGNYYQVLNVFDTNEEILNSYDFIILSEVIEHVNNPAEYINQLKRFLTPKGKIIVTTPNKKCAVASCIWDTDLPPVHQWWFSDNSLKYLADNLQLKVSFIDFSSFYFHNFQSLKKSTKYCDKKSVKPLLDKEGNMKINETNVKTIPEYKLKLGKLAVFKYLYHKATLYNNWKRYLISRQGRIICAVFEKNE